MQRQTSCNTVKLGFSALFVTVALLLSGCTNLEAVRKFAKVSAATADYQQVVQDYADSPKRQQSYRSERTAAQLDDVIKRRAAQKLQLEGVQKVLVEYMSALGDLAADKVASVDDEIDGIRKSLEDAKFVGDGNAQVKEETATAAATIAKVVIRATLDHWRQRQVAKIVKQVDPHLQVVVAGLEEILDKDLRSSLDNEKDALSRPFQAWIAAATSGNDPDGAPPVAKLLLKERLDQLDSKRMRLDAYIKILDTIGKGHADLLAHVDQMDREALKKKLQEHLRDLKTLDKAIRDLTK